MKFPRSRKGYMVIIEIAQEVETSSPEEEKRYLPGRRLFPKVRIYNIGAVDLCGKQTSLIREL